MARRGFAAGAFGRRHPGPSDALDAEIAAILTRPCGGPALEALLAGCYRPQAENDAVGALQHAVNLIGASQSPQKKLHQALKAGHVQPAAGENAIDAALAAGALSAAEAQTLHQTEAARRRVIDVDDFSQDELKLSRGKVR